MNLDPVQFKCDLTILTSADSGPRDPAATIWTVLHTTENNEHTDPAAVAKWQQNTANNSSYNILVGSRGQSVRSNDDNYTPWSAGQPGNRLGIHVSAVGRAARSRDEWLGEFYPQLETMAKIAADHNLRYGRPLVWLTPQEVAARVPGICSHATYWQAIGRAQGMDTRTDPGDGFPVDVFLDLARRFARGELTEDTGGGEEMSMGEHDPLPLIADQLLGFPYYTVPGWPQLGGMTLVDAVATIGHHLNIEGFLDMRKNTE